MKYSRLIDGDNTSDDHTIQNNQVVHETKTVNRINYIRNDKVIPNIKQKDYDEFYSNL